MRRSQSPYCSRPRRAGRMLALLVGGAASVFFLLAAHGAPSLGAAPTSHPFGADTVEADTTDSTDVVPLSIPESLPFQPAPPDAAPPLLPDVLVRADSNDAQGDTVEATPLADRYLPASPHPGRLPALAPAPAPLTDLHVLNRSVSLDSADNAYTVAVRAGGLAVRPPLTVSREVYRRAQRRAALRTNWRTLEVERTRQARQAGTTRDGLGLTVAIPGGRRSTFSTIFGSPEVDLRVTGLADINAGFDYRKSDQRGNRTGNPSSVDPDFAQELRLGITGTIGDKLQINVNWDTQNPFEYQNQVRLEYTGYDDEIIQKIEAGNVFLNTPSTLIQGGQSLFGIKGQFQFGNLRLTTVASQQEGQAQSLTLEGGARTRTFTLSPTDYDESTHFFLAYYFRNRWNEALAEPPTIQTFDGFGRITEIEVWRLQTNADLDDRNVRRAVAVVDLGESDSLLTLADAFTRHILPAPDVDQYSTADLERLHNPAVSASDFAPDFGLHQGDYQTGKFRLLERGRDFVFNERLGYLSLRQPLQDNEALAVAFRYRAGGRTVQVGEFSDEAGGSVGGANAARLILKLLRPAQPRQPAPGRAAAAWFLEMRNIYPLRGRNITQESFQLDIRYAPPGQTPQETLPEVGQQTLLQLLGLDRLNNAGAPQPDNQFDFIRGITINPAEGLLIFPYLEPFGERLVTVIRQSAPPGQAERLIDELAFPSLYRLKQRNAQNAAESYNVYRIEGELHGLQQQFYDLRAPFGLVEGSVEVTAGGTPLRPGVDYTVNYQTGSVRILNEALLAPGSTIDISYEQNAVFNVRKKTLLGARADYALGEKLSLGATLMRLSEQSPVDKYRIGQEPISNMIWGVDGALLLEQPRWLTRAVDALPLVETKAASRISIAAEFAQLRPGHARTNAFERTRTRLQDQGVDFRPDELGGISYIDDFESFENTLSLARPAEWQLAAPPFTPDLLGAPPAQRAQQRGGLAWYRLGPRIREDLEGRISNPDDPAAQLVKIREVFPNRDTRGQVNNTLPTFDLYFAPRRRGPYNFTRNLAGFMTRPKENWGGITRQLPEGFNDFTLNNVEFVEFVFKPFSQHPTGDAGDAAVLYVDLGAISEDIVPDGRLNLEDGLSTTSFDSAGFSELARLPTSGYQNGAVDVQGGRTEDLGFDGFVSYAPGDYPQVAREAFQHRDFLNAIETSARPASLSERYAATVARAQNDPSGDDYQHYLNDAYFGNERFFPGGATLQERFLNYNAGSELNSFEAQNVLAEGTTTARGNTRAPDSEDLNFNYSVDLTDSYFQYKIPLSRDKLDALAAPTRTDDYIVGEIKDDNGNGTGWYQVRIPIRSPAKKPIGNISGFSLIESIRLWTTGHRAPITLRFATLELVGSQWRASERVTGAVGDTLMAAGDAELLIASVNNEENAGIYQPPLRAIIGRQRQTRGGVQRRREQALVMQIDGLAAAHERAIYKTYGEPYNLLKYKNLRMFVHLHGRTAGGRELGPDDRGAVELFVRLGANETEDYYQYVQPLTPTRLRTGLTARQLWPLENEVNLPLGALNQLKVARDRLGKPPDSLFERGGEALGVGLKEDVRLGIKGTPSLREIRTIVVGLRNATTGEVLDVTAWINELRVTGYDEKPGWAAQATADVKLADFGSVSASFRRQTDGFGALSSTLTERSLNDVLEWRVATQFGVHKLLPREAGLQIPVTLQMSSRTSTPRFAPSRGDVRLSEITSQIEARDSLSAEQKAQRKRQVIRAAQTHNTTRTFSVGFRKESSESALLRYTLDALALSYRYNSTRARSPSRRLNRGWHWNASLQYQLAFEPHTVQPFQFLSGVPVLGAFGDLRFNYAPSAVGFSATADRRFGAQQGRSLSFRSGSDGLADPLRTTQQFTHDRRFNLQYQPFEFLNLSFSTVTDQSLSTISADTLYSVRTMGGLITGTDEFGTLDRAEADTLVARRLEKGQQAYRQERLQLDPFTQVLGDFFSRGPRTNSYEQRFAGTLSLPFGQSKALNWISFDDISYQSIFQWNNGPRGRGAGAAVSNEVTLRTGLSISPHKLWRKFGFYRRLEKQAQSEEQTQIEEAPTARGTLPGPPADTTAAPSDSVSVRGGGFLSDLLPNPVDLLRGLFLAVTGVRNVEITYTATREATSTGVGRLAGSDVRVSHSLFDALRGLGPSLGYRFGLSRRVGPGRRLFGSDYQITDNFSDGNHLRGRATLTPTSELQISLNWDVQWRRGRSVVYGGKGLVSSRTETGANQATVWAFGGSYLNLFKRQLATFRGDYVEGQTTVSDTGDGRVVLTNASVRTDFRAAFLTGPGPVDGLGLLPFPMPAWNVRYTGLADWPLVRAVVESATLQHGYSATFTSAYHNNTAELGDASFALSNLTVTYQRPAFTAGDLHISERYQPMLALDLNWKGGLQTRIAWNRQNDYYLSTVSNELTARQTNELTLTANFRTQGSIDLPLFGEIDNRLNFSLTLSHATNRERRYSLKSALAAAAADPAGFDPHMALKGDNAVTNLETSRLAITPKISYRFNDRIAADFLLQYERFNGDNRRPSYTNVSGGFNVRVSLSN